MVATQEPLGSKITSYSDESGEGRRREGGVSRKAGASGEGGLSRRQERMSPQGNRAGPRT